MDRVLICCEDLFFRVSIEAGIRSEGLAPVVAPRLADVEAALSSPAGGRDGDSGPAAGRPRLRAAVVDLASRSGEALEVIARLAAANPGIPVLAFGPHGQAETLEAARRAGATAVPRSRFVREYPAFLRKVAQGAAPGDPGCGPAPGG